MLLYSCNYIHVTRRQWALQGDHVLAQWDEKEGQTFLPVFLYFFLYKVSASKSFILEQVWGCVYVLPDEVFCVTAKATPRSFYSVISQKSALEKLFECLYSGCCFKFECYLHLKSKKCLSYTQN